jgi:two-component system phosphate regulon response regulator PhoB
MSHPEPARRAPCVLVAEDDRFIRRIAEIALERQGFTVRTAEDGESALRQVRESPPDVVLLDLIMPKVQGFEVLRRLKQDPATAGVPIIVLSSLGQEPDVRRALEAGAAGYLVKAERYLQNLADELDKVLRR